MKINGARFTQTSRQHVEIVRFSHFPRERHRSDNVLNLQIYFLALANCREVERQPIFKIASKRGRGSVSEDSRHIDCNSADCESKRGGRQQSRSTTSLRFILS